MMDFILKLVLLNPVAPVFCYKERKVGTNPYARDIARNPSDLMNSGVSGLPYDYCRCYYMANLVQA